MNDHLQIPAAPVPICLSRRMRESSNITEHSLDQAIIRSILYSLCQRSRSSSKAINTPLKSSSEHGAAASAKFSLSFETGRWEATWCI